MDRTSTIDVVEMLPKSMLVAFDMVRSELGVTLLLPTFVAMVGVVGLAVAVEIAM